MIFVSWLLKFVINFSILERNLSEFDDLNLNTNISKIFSKILNLFTTSFLSKVKLTYSDKLNLNFFDAYYTYFSIFNIKKNFYSYSLKRTMYPDQGKTVNIFPVYNNLVYKGYQFKQSFNTGKLTLQSNQTRGDLMNSSLNVFRQSLHDIAYLFPYERVQIHSHGPYPSVESHIFYHMYIVAYWLTLKHNIFNKYTEETIRRNYIFRVVGIKNFLGIKAEDKKSYGHFQNISAYSVPFFLLSKFYGTESKMFFFILSTCSSSQNFRVNLNLYPSFYFNITIISVIDFIVLLR